MTITAIPYTPPADTVTALADTSNQAQTTTTATDLAGIVANTTTTVANTATATADTPVTTTDASGVTITNTTIGGTPAIITTTPANTATGTVETTTVTLLTSDTTATPVVTDTPVTTTNTTTTTDTTTNTAVTNTPTNTVTTTDTVLVDPAVTTTTTATPETTLTAQSAPAITDILAQDGTAQIRVFDGSHITDTAPVIKGTAMPGVEVGIFDNGHLLGKATADDNWAWSFQSQAWKDDPTAATGLHAFTAAHLNADDSPGLTSVYSYTCAINADPRPLLVPVITQVIDNTGNSDSNVLDLVAPLGDTTPEFQGTSQPGTLVTLYDNGVKVLQATTGADWLWHAALTDPLAAGPHTFTVEATYPDGLGVTAAPYQYDCVITMSEGAGAANTVVTPAADLPAVVPANVLDTTTTSLDQLLANAGLVAATPVAATPVTGSTTDTVPLVQATSLNLAALPQHDLAY